MRQLVWKSSVIALFTALGCGDSTGGGGDKPDSDAGSLTASIVYPDSLCTDTGCIANADVAGTCDPNSSDPAVDDCNAWRINGSFSLNAVKIDSTAKRGTPTPPKRDGDDLCPPNTVTPPGKTEHCCERVSVQAAKPAFMLTSIQLKDPPVFRLQNVSTANKDAIEQDRYNWVMELSSDQPGDVIITSGLGLQNVDGSYAFAEGPFELGGVTWNKDGAWDPHVVPGTLSEDGILSYKGQYIPEGRYFELPTWGNGYSYTQMELSMTGIEMSIQLSDDKLCAGFLTGNRTFAQVGEIKAYLPLEPFRNVSLHFNKGDDGTSLCALTASVKPGECAKPVSQWGK